MIETMTRERPRPWRAQAKKGYLAATDVADYLAKKGMPFRRAHEVVGHLVLVPASSAAAIWKTSRWTISRRRAIFSNPISWNA